MTQFDWHCNKILDGYKLKFPLGADKESYLDTFSHSKWCELPENEQKQHSLAKCASCYELHQNSQLSFPLKPTYHHKPIVMVDQDALKRLGVITFTSGVLTELNRVYEAEASASFTNALVITKSSGLEHKKNKKDKRREKIKVQKELTKAVNDHCAEKAAISMLTECESKRKYHRKRMSQSFESPPPAKKTKTHSPDFSNVSWDKEKLKETIENWPVVQPGAIEAEIGSMISSGRFTLGDECAPYTITKYTMVNGMMTPHELQIQGRKVPRIELRQRLLTGMHALWLSSETVQ